MNNLTLEQITTIQNIFNNFDSNPAAMANRRELGSLSIALNDPLTPAELADFFKSIDTDNSGSITWDEFITYWGNN